MGGGVASEAASQANPEGFSVADFFKPFQLPISKVSSSDVIKALGKFLPVRYQKGITSNQGLGCPACPESPYHIGDYAQGGVIIWLTNDGMHGLVAAKDNISELSWLTNNTESTGTYNNNSLPLSTPNIPYGQYYGGYKNQQAIKEKLDWQTKYPAFAAAANYSITIKGVTYDDWWLPSSTELSAMYVLRQVINDVSTLNDGSPLDGTYWSSRQNEISSQLIWNLSFSNGTVTATIGTDSQNVRCVRAF